MLASPFFTLGRERSGRAVERAAFTMGSIVTFTLYHAPEREAEAALDEAIREMKEIDRLMSVFDPSSQLSQLNAAAARRQITVDRRILEVCAAAGDYCRLTGGAFDPTVEPLMELYGFRNDARTGRFPTDAEIRRALEAVGMANVELDAARRTVAFRREGTRLDFGGIAVGYAVDRAAAVLRSRGVTSCLINHSGDLYAIGGPPDDERWEIGIRDPLDAEGVVARLRIRDQALCTSGNYENFLRAGDRTIGHILDPGTGRDAERLLGATVVAPTAIEADALSTALFVMGEAQGRRRLAGRSGVSGLAVLPGDRTVRIP